MGCKQINDVKVYPVGSSTRQFKLKIQNDSEPRYFNYSSQNDSELLADVMNNICFGEHFQQLNPNFVSIFDPSSKSFKYYIQRLFDHEVDVEGDQPQTKHWKVFINNEQYSWHTILDENIQIHYSDQVLVRLI